jgi:hypothetical protein
VCRSFAASGRTVSVADLEHTWLRSLLLSPPPEFVAARNALAKELRADGRRDDAAAVAGLRRPGWVDWALVRTADDDPGTVASFAAAAAAMRSAQDATVAGRPADVAGSLRAVRDAATTLAKRADATLRTVGRATELPAILERLTAIAGDAGSSAALVAGVLHPDLTPDAAPGAEPDPSPDPTRERAPHPAPTRPRPSRKRPAPPPETAAASAEPDVPSRHEVDEAVRALRLAEQASARAERRADEAERSFANAERAARKANEVLAVATGQAADARQRLTDARATAAEAAERLEELRRARERESPGRVSGRNRRRP